MDIVARKAPDQYRQLYTTRWQALLTQAPSGCSAEEQAAYLAQTLIHRQPNEQGVDDELRCPHQEGSEEQTHRSGTAATRLPTPDELIDKVAAAFGVPRDYITVASLHLILTYLRELHIPKHAARWLLTRVLGLTKREIMRCTGYSTSDKSSPTKSFRFVERDPKLLAKLNELCEAEGWVLLDDEAADVQQHRMIDAITAAVIAALERPATAQQIVQGGRGGSDNGKPAASHAVQVRCG